MRNPWGTEGYTGAWSDKDPMWTQELRNLVGGHTDADDGFFFLPVETFRYAFSYYYIGMYQDWNVSKWSNTSDG